MPLLLLLLLLPAPAGAHAIGSSVAELHQRGPDVTLALGLHEGEAAAFVWLDADRDGAVGAAELAAAAPSLAEAVFGPIGLSVEAGTCVRGGARVEGEPGEGVRIEATFRCPAAPAPTLSLALGHLASLPSGHRVIGRAVLDGVERAFLADASQQGVQLRGPERAFGPFVRLGVEHILGGFDHLLFLAALLLVVRSLREAATIVTAFTLAHSLTLAAASLGLVSLPARLVEATIAASIVFVAAENVLAKRPRARPLVTFAFGLVHGFGFARVLQELGLSGRAALLPLFGFNLGVELGQLCVVALVVPPLLWLQRRQSYDARWRPVGSALVAAAGAYWLVERLT